MLVSELAYSQSESSNIMLDSNQVSSEEDKVSLEKQLQSIQQELDLIDQKLFQQKYLIKNIEHQYQNELDKYNKLSGISNSSKKEKLKESLQEWRKYVERNHIYHDYLAGKSGEIEARLHVVKNKLYQLQLKELGLKK